ncbi:hypothetical protein CAI21_21590 [Alkalilimnicola ehrlichii]|uniref:Uncharacterized protein n=1 Tax=Alkalilimnicola ehrlichii TaxID=351052 RepID=A0A3E0WQR4_9GAMM|nr:hypothetical protein [Alkalilimnicola ehrlichii]RFA24419.1 hypothetical protein CAI21_21590 [Alkalilimnicola ehrlichii]RFA35168.1 hypothetical protein CAL65_13775 [Alkalilimnicola ehrlichii]
MITARTQAAIDRMEFKRASARQMEDLDERFTTLVTLATGYDSMSLLCDPESDDYRALKVKWADVMAEAEREVERRFGHLHKEASNTAWLTA